MPYPQGDLYVLGEPVAVITLYLKNGTLALSITTFSITALSTKGLSVTLSKNDTQHNNWFGFHKKILGINYNNFMAGQLFLDFISCIRVEFLINQINK